ncbi:prephenate dehydratase [Natronincola peptidivorans]|uniref:Prephenate dehydratase n=1 Tax=Natronincola peptidivorans TaxID=426128 RepID=A0A1I0A4R7_9FIRM|nr:prephenate dehydratase [Natronincola peptidivorans]SES89111.1 prephenate dehydratase [Natronincola peptidivorans]
MELGYLGPMGSYSYTAAKYYDPKSLLVGMKTFREIITTVEEGSIEEGILPIENSTEGAVTQVMDNLMETEESKIQGEIILQVRHNLLTVAEDASELKYVLSHPQALEQCREFFANQFPEVVLIPCESSSTACKIAKEKGIEYGAIGNILAGENNGLHTLYKDIQDNLNNQTRFVIIGRKNTVPTGKDKTSIAFSFHDDFPGSLHSILKEFAEENINLTRIESRPAKTELGRYIFYVDFNGHQEDLQCKRVLNNIEKITNKLKIFGSYPIGQIY